MRFRKDFVTNSSSSSFICCFARIADPEKATAALSEHKANIEIYSAADILAEMGDCAGWSNWLEWDWAGVDITPSRKYIEDHMSDSFIVVTECQDLEEDEDGEVNYNVDYSDFSKNTISTIDAINEENGFADIDVQIGAGRNG